VDTICAALSEEKDTVEDVVEPYLIQIGMIHRTPRGRMATDHAYSHLGKSPKRGSSNDLFNPDRNK